MFWVTFKIIHYRVGRFWYSVVTRIQDMGKVTLGGSVWELVDSVYSLPPPPRKGMFGITVSE